MILFRPALKNPSRKSSTKFSRNRGLIRMKLRKYGNFYPGQATTETRSDLLEDTRIRGTICQRKSALMALKTRMLIMTMMMKRTSQNTTLQTLCLWTCHLSKNTTADRRPKQYIIARWILPGKHCDYVDVSVFGKPVMKTFCHCQLNLQLVKLVKSLSIKSILNSLIL